MPKNWKTKLIHSDAHAPEGFRSLPIPIYRGSTVLFPNAAAVDHAWDQYEVGYTYGLYGTPTTLELAARIASSKKGL
jgi:cysteine-S-conjugate beta-lyase